MFSKKNSTTQFQMDSRTPPPPACVSLARKSRHTVADVQKKPKAIKICVIDVGVRYPSEWYKTFTMFLYAASTLLLSSSVILVSAKRSSVNHPISPAVVFSPTYMRDSKWAFEISRAASFLLLALWFLQWLLLQYKSIVGRRFLFIIGTLHLYRSLIIYIMVLPIPSSNVTCEEKFSEDWKVFLKQTLQLASETGLFQKSSVLCGIYMYGHPANLILTYLFIKAYSPGKFQIYHVLCWCLCVIGLVSPVLLYAYHFLDVAVSYFMTTKLFWWYHTLANHQWLKRTSPQNYLSSIWWFRIFIFCEENILGIIPHSYSWPISCSVCQE